LVIGGYQSLEVWNMVKNQSLTVQAHEGLIAALAQSPVTGMELVSIGAKLMNALS